MEVPASNPEPPPSDQTHLRASPFALFTTFFRLGLTAFGGPAMVAYIRELAVTKKRWLSKVEFQDGVSLCQSIPGATAMQTAAYVGLRSGGPQGALAAFAGFGLPAFVLMLALSAAYQAGRDLAPVLAAFRGLNVIVIAIIANAAVNSGVRTVKNWRDALLTAGATAALIFHGNPLLVIVAATLISVILYRGVETPIPETHGGSADHARRMLCAAAILAALAVAGMAVLFLLSHRLFNLALVMMKVDLFAIGGGFASVPLMLHEIVDVRHWIESRIFMDGIALGQVTPGPIVITATFVGYQVAGVLGALAATVGIFTPSFLMVLVAVPYFDRLQSHLWFRRALRGVLASFVGLLTAVAVNFGVAVSWSLPAALIAAAAFAALRLKVDILWVVLAGAALSVLLL